ncbi:hypothetical protein [Caldimonas tepidiphila]|uniref:hypothetical protein n=1 Tax=Caldimonas tepidiphila TaxID=2315841 RepID=UPI000E5A4E4D|nr:hypothetical protein [Caldimonas tepidiphila]
MKNLQEVTERVCELKGSLVALDVLVTAMLQALPEEARAELLQRYAAHAEVARVALMHTAISEHTIAAFENDVRRTLALAPPDKQPLHG